MLPLLDSNGVAINKGRFINLIDGIQGVAAGGVASINVPVNRRVHRLLLQCTAVNYTGGTLQATKHLTGGGNDALVGTVAVSATQVPLTFTATTAGNGYNVGDTFTTVDATGTGAVFTVATLTGGAGTGVATATYNALSATASPIDPGALLSTVKQLVNGVTMRDITARFAIMIAQACGDLPLLGDLHLYYTEPARNEIRPNEATSWDLLGQNTFQVIPTLNAGYLSPGITGVMEFDYLRNSYTPKGSTTAVANLEPVTHHLYTYNIAGGVNPITTIPIEYPIARMWLLGSIPGNLTALEILQDGNKRLEGSVNAIKAEYTRYGFQFGQANYANQTQTAAKPLGYNPINYFDAAFISDVSGRYDRALKNANSLSFRVTSAQAQILSVVVEALPGAYAT